MGSGAPLIILVTTLIVFGTSTPVLGTRNNGHCKPGQGGSKCSPCPVGYWSRGGSRNPCTKCKPGFTTKGSGATKPEQCYVCQPGRAGTKCALCPVGYWASSGQDCSHSKCSRCPAGFTTHGTGASKPQHCNVCQAGRGGPNCALCRTGYWSRGAASSVACSRCKVGFSTRSYGATRPEDCKVCLPGYGGPSCTPCPAGTWSKGGPGRTACTPCKQGFTTKGRYATAPQQCNMCRAGRGGPKCDLCLVGTWSKGGSTAPCRRCGTGFTTKNCGATSDAECNVCLPGFGGPKCRICALGFYSRGGAFCQCQTHCGTTCDCKACKSGFTTTKPGATHRHDCNGCLPGYANDGSDNCKKCPAGTASWGGPLATAVCTNCTNSTIAASSGMASCTPCPPGTAPNAARTACNTTGVQVTICLSGLTYDAAGMDATVRSAVVTALGLSAGSYPAASIGIQASQTSTKATLLLTLSPTANVSEALLQASTAPNTTFLPFFRNNLPPSWFPKGGSICRCSAGSCLGTEYDVIATVSPCNSDVCILLDGSGSITGTPNAWEIEVNVVESIIKSMGNDNALVAVLEFSTTTKTHVAPTIKKSVDLLSLRSIQPMADSTNMEPAITACQTLLQSAPSMAASPNKKVIVMLTDGEPSDSPIPVATTVKQNGTVIITVGVGSLNKANLLALSSGAPYQFDAPAFSNNVTNIGVDIAPKVCA